LNFRRKSIPELLKVAALLAPTCDCIQNLLGPGHFGQAHRLAEFAGRGPQCGQFMDPCDFPRIIAGAERFRIGKRKGDTSKPIN
jgi:enhancing lycopene biosynthesis protein 2